MRALPIYQIDAFATDLFEGNPAAVCPLDSWLTDKEMQNIALENNLSETAFLFLKKTDFTLDGLLQMKKLLCVVMQHLQVPMLFSRN